jgi:hypothetical protein
MSRFKPPNGTLAASSGFDQQSMIALASSRILELGATVMEGWPTRRPEPRFSFLTSAFLDHGYDRPFALAGHHQNLLDLAIYQQDAVGTLAGTEPAPL